MSKGSISSADRNMATVKVGEGEFAFFDLSAAPFELAGLPFYHSDAVFRRLPAEPSPAAPNPGVEHLSWHTAGAQIRFRSDSSRVAVRAFVRFDDAMDHMPQTGMCGCDIYAAESDGPLLFHGVTRYDVGVQEYSCELFRSPAPGIMREFVINLPLYNGVTGIEVGVVPGATISAPTPWARKGKLVWYGTSIQQGGCASRPGMGLTNIVSRRLGMEIVNLAFSGSGKGEKEMAELMLQVNDGRVFILDYEANAMTLENLTATLPVLLDILRNARPEAPIVVISRIKFAQENVPGWHENTSRECRLKGVEIQRKEVNRRRRRGDKNIHFIDGGILLGKDFHECTVDGIHPTDLGFMRMADALTPRLEKLI